MLNSGADWLNSFVLYLAFSLLLNFGTRWVDRDLLNCLPNPLEERSKKCMSLIVFDPRDESCDLYQDCYRPLELTVASETFVFKEASHSVRDYMPNCCTSYRWDKPSEI